MHGGPVSSGTNGSVDVKGGAPGTRETDAIRPGTAVNEIHAVLLTGGSASVSRPRAASSAGSRSEGSASTQGWRGSRSSRPPCCSISRWAKRRPGPTRRPGTPPVRRRRTDPSRRASAPGPARRSPSCRTRLRLEGRSGQRVGRGGRAGRLGARRRERAGDGAGRAGRDRREPQPGRRAPDVAGHQHDARGGRDERGLSKERAQLLAQAGSEGVSLAVTPAHTMWDGDTVFAIATGEVDAPQRDLEAMASRAVAEAIRRGSARRVRWAVFRPSGRGQTGGRGEGGDMRTLEEAALDASTCTRCRLSQGRTQVVYGVGDPNADLMFIGEAPGIPRGQAGRAVRRGRRPAAEPAPHRDRRAAGRRLHQQRDLVQASRQPGPAPRRARGVQALARRAGRAHRPRRRGHARELGDPVHPRQAGVDQPGPRPAVPLERSDRDPDVPPRRGPARRWPGLEPDDRPAPTSRRSAGRSPNARSPPRNSSACSDAHRAPSRDGRGHPFDRGGHRSAPVAGDAIALTGELGAGKTTFAQGVARGLDFPGHVVSPTFTLVREYRSGRLPIVHADVSPRAGPGRPRPRARRRGRGRGPARRVGRRGGGAPPGRAPGDRARDPRRHRGTLGRASDRGGDVAPALGTARASAGALEGGRVMGSR